MRVRISGPAGIERGDCEWAALSPPSIPWLRCPWARHRTPNCSPGAGAMAAHCSRCSQCVCSLLTAVCVHLDGLNAEDQFRVWVTIFDNTLQFILLFLSLYSSFHKFRPKTVFNQKLNEKVIALNLISSAKKFMSSSVFFSFSIQISKHP